ncbi:PstS family phosphate ABC transporter substrate-binding protein [Nocardia sp. NPDC058176]|uniref:PstS family phosphate ABC transporter substrate-binding protein n=1 Tax=Nocardia sp. NPDC058176 TaxID=3346368 RepID=UPI0036DC2FFE
MTAGELVGEFPFEVVLSIIGIVVAVAAFLREFVLVGRRRLGYRVQMDTPVTGEIEFSAPNTPTDPDVTGALRNLRTTVAGGQDWQLKKLSLVLVRIENSGSLGIDAADYTMRSDGQPTVGLHLSFPGREVIGVAVTELQGVPRDNLGDGSGIARRVEGSPAHEPGGTSNLVGVVDLPKVPLERGDHYKILAVLNRPNDGDPTPEPELAGGIKGGRVVTTRSNSRPPWILVALSLFLLTLVVVQLVLAVVRADPPPRDCAAGELTLVGSSAMAPMIRTAAENYAATCTEARFQFDFAGTEPGLRAITLAGPTPDMLAIGDGDKGDSFAALTEHPLALASFSMIVHPAVGLKDLSTQQIRDLYRGTVTNWRQLGGPDLPVVLIDRTAGSGTRRALEARLLEDNRKVFRYTSCVGMAAGGPQCEVDVTEEVATFVAKIPGAVGYLETSAIGADVTAVSIDGVAPSPQTLRAGTYPFIGIEYAYTHGSIAGDSLAAQFLDYLTRGKARLTMAEFGNIPCIDPVEPTFCTP